MKNKALTIMLIFGVMLLLCGSNVFANEVLEIEDPQLLEALEQYDNNEDGQIQRGEIPYNCDLILDGYKIQSLKGLEGISFWEISMKNCGLTKLPDGIDEIIFQKMHLNNNRLTDVNEIEDYLETLKYGYLSHYIILEDNPVYDDAIEYIFNDYYYNLSIIGKAGTISWQKMETRHKLRIDDMDSSIPGDEYRRYPSIISDFSNLDNWKFEIEDTSIAEIVGTKTLKRSYTDTAFIDHVDFQSDKVLEIKLIKEGHTRMKITNGEYVKYTDIWVLPESADETGVGKFAIPCISDIGIGTYLTKSFGIKEYSGIYNCDYLLSSEAITVYGGRYNIKDFTTFSLCENLKKIRLRDYSDDLIRSVVGLEKIESLSDVEIYATEKQLSNNERFLESCKYIKNLLGEDYIILNDIDAGKILIKKIPESINMGDVNNDKQINAADALLILKKAAELTDFDEIQTILADITENGIINADDALEVLKTAAKITK